MHLTSLLGQLSRDKLAEAFLSYHLNQPSQENPYLINPQTSYILYCLGLSLTFLAEEKNKSETESLRDHQKDSDKRSMTGGRNYNSTSTFYLQVSHIVVMNMLGQKTCFRVAALSLFHYVT